MSENGADSQPTEAMSQTSTSEESGSGESQDWRDSISDDYRSNPAIADYKDINDLVKSHISAQSMIGNSIRIPSKEAGQEQWDAFYSRFNDVPGLMRYNPDNPTEVLRKIGAPEDADGYKWTPPEGFEPDPDTVKGFKDLAYALNLTNEQASGLMSHMAKDAVADNQRREQEMKEAIDGMKKEWGMAFDEKMGEATRAVAILGGQELVDVLNETGLGNHPAMIKLFANLGSQLKEPATLPGQGSQAGVLTPEEAQSQIEDIYNNKEHPYHEGNPEAIKKMQRLFGMAYPEEVQ